MASESTSSQQSQQLIPSSKVNFKALTLQPFAMYAKYLKEFWYTVEVEDDTKTITFLLSWWDKPLSFTQDEFVSTIGLPICKNAILLPPTEIVRAGLVTLGLFDKDKPTLSSIVLVNSSPLKMNNDLTLVKPHTIIAASFQKPLASEVPLTSHMLKVAKLSEGPEQSLIPPSRDVNVDDTADKSLPRTTMQLVTQPKAPTDWMTKKRRIPSSSKPKSPNKATADATKSLASESAEEQGNQPSTAVAEKVLDQNVKKEKDAEFLSREEVAEEQSKEISTVEQLLDEVDKQNKATMHDSKEIVDSHKGSDSDLQSMPDDNLRSVSGFYATDSEENVVSKSDNIVQDDHVSAERLSLPDHWIIFVKKSALFIQD
ncbi:hypothetical protein Tco_0047097 [Tanacetum coccineum]